MGDDEEDVLVGRQLEQGDAQHQIPTEVERPTALLSEPQSQLALTLALRERAQVDGGKR